MLDTVKNEPRWGEILESCYKVCDGLKDWDPVEVGKSGFQLCPSGFVGVQTRKCLDNPKKDYGTWEELSKVSNCQLEGEEMIVGSYIVSIYITVKNMTDTINSDILLKVYEIMNSILKVEMQSLFITYYVSKDALIYTVKALYPNNQNVKEYESILIKSPLESELRKLDHDNKDMIVEIKVDESVQPPYVPPKEPVNKAVIWGSVGGVLALIVIVAIGVGVYFYQRNKPKKGK